MTAFRAPRAASLDLRLLRALPFATVCVLVSALGHALAGGGPVPLPTLLVGLVLVLLAGTALAGRERSLPAIASALAVGELGLHALFHLCAGASGMAGMSGMPGMSGMTGMAGMSGMPGMSGTGGGTPSALLQLAARLLCGPGPDGSLALPPGTTASQIVSQAGIDPHLYLASISTAPAAHGVGAFCAMLGLSPLMVLGHLLAALVAGWWLRGGEAAVWRLLGLALAPLGQLLRMALALLAGLTTTGALRPVRRWSADAWRLPAHALLRHQLVRRGPPRALLA
ncbi:hypothetical protein [Streptacidiphilus fuscans]|uniref:Integral membrane protein n=1 Tax=Streptacidiphilus fuscans TaxID=2789292 RepID=A0A931B5W4_9ACTN|nr:hypothetical protein [Streptacidiphilus fuscans]MBF9070828.1 hypothetical protein [Streptacidiphilus fuscans]